MTERMENALNHIKTSVDVDPWAIEVVEKVFKAYEQQPQDGDEIWWGNNFNTITIKSASQPQEPVGNTDTLNNDLISRQAVIKAMEEENTVSFYEAEEQSRETYYDLKAIVKNMPSVSQLITDQWIEHEVCGTRMEVSE